MGRSVKLGLVLLSVLSARAQLVVSARAGLINFSQGNSSLDGERLSSRAKPRQMQPGQTVSTGRGRVEVLLAPAIVMRLGDTTSVRIEDTRLEDTRVTIEKGSVLIEVVEVEKDSRLRIFVGDSETEFRRTGLYRFEASPARLQVYGGEAAVAARGIPIAAKRGQAVDLTTFELAEFAPGPADALHIWSAQRSFALFNSSVETRNKQKHWEYIGQGWVRNKNYALKYYSGQARRDNSWAEQQLGRPSITRADHE